MRKILVFVGEVILGLAICLVILAGTNGCGGMAPAMPTCPEDNKSDSVTGSCTPAPTSCEVPDKLKGTWYGCDDKSGSTTDCVFEAKMENGICNIICHEENGNSKPWCPLSTARISDDFFACTVAKNGNTLTHTLVCSGPPTP